MRNIIYNYSKEELQELLNNSDSFADVFRKIGITDHGGSYKIIHKLIDQYNLDLTLLISKRENLKKEIRKITSKRFTTPLEEILKKDSSYNSSRLLNRLIKEGLKTRECEECGINNWRDKPISLQLHHKDGNRKNNELSNLQILCPNCHSQTDNYMGKNKTNYDYYDSKAKKGITEDGQRLYTGKGYYKVLCPVCKINYKSKDAKMCKECFNKNNNFIPKAPKEELFTYLENHTCIETAKHFHVCPNTIRSWKNFYEKEII